MFSTFLPGKHPKISRAFRGFQHFALFHALFHVKHISYYSYQHQSHPHFMPHITHSVHRNQALFKKYQIKKCQKVSKPPRNQQIFTQITKNSPRNNRLYHLKSASPPISLRLLGVNILYNMQKRDKM